MGADLGQDAKKKAEPASKKSSAVEEKYDKLELRNRTITETLSPISDLGQDAKPKNGNAASNGNKSEEFDKLELRNRTVTETLSRVADFGQDKPDEPKTKKQKFDTLSLRNRDVTETLSPIDA